MNKKTTKSSEQLLFNKQDHQNSSTVLKSVGQVPSKTADARHGADFYLCCQFALIWSLEHQGFWKSERNGYTPDIREAGRYSIFEAEEICSDANMGGEINEVLLYLPDQTFVREGLKR